MAERLEDRLAAVPLPWLTVPLVVIAATAVAGNAFAPALLANHPLALLGLNATTRHLVLTSTTVDVVPWFAVALVRRSLEDPFLFLLGWRYGDDALVWAEERFGGGRWLAAAQRGFRRWGWVLVAFFPGGVVCVLAGASRMPLAGFLVVAVGGTIATVALIRVLGDTLADPVDAVVDVTIDRWLWLTVVSVVLTAGWWAHQRRRRRPSGGEPADSPAHP